MIYTLSAATGLERIALTPLLFKGVIRDTHKKKSLLVDFFNRLLTAEKNARRA
jgi:hypothetical protein